MVEDNSELQVPVWQELRVRGQPDILKEFISTLDAILPNEWEKTDCVTGGSIDRHGYLLKTFGKKGLKFWLWQQSPFELYLQDIVPEDAHDNLPIEARTTEYNRRLKFFEALIQEAAVSVHGVKICVEKAQKSIEDIVSSDIAGLLKSFSRSANKSTLHSHPCDHGRWMKFLFAVHETQANDRLSVSFLRQWLVTDGWDQHAAASLASEFEHDLQVLSDYDRHLAGLSLN